MKIKLIELKRIIREIIIEEAKKDPERYSLDFGWGIKNKKQPKVDWVDGPHDDRLHYDKDVFVKFAKDMLGLDVDKTNKKKDENAAVPGAATGGTHTYVSSF